MAINSLHAVARRLPKGELVQNGLVRQSLCPRCNSFAGAEYVPSVIEWTKQARLVHSRITGGGTVLATFHADFQRVVKQMAVMAVAMSEEGAVFTPTYSALRKFALDPRQVGGVESFRFYTYLHMGGVVCEGMLATIDTLGGASPFIHCHVGTEPLGYIVTADDSSSVDWAAARALCNLSAFGNKPPVGARVEHLHLPVLRGEMPLRPLPRSRVAAENG